MVNSGLEQDHKGRCRGWHCESNRINCRRVISGGLAGLYTSASRGVEPTPSILWCWGHSLGQAELFPVEPTWAQWLPGMAISSPWLCGVCWDWFSVSGVCNNAMLSCSHSSSAGEIPGTCFFRGGVLAGPLSPLQPLSELWVGSGGSQCPGMVWSAHFPSCQSTLLPELKGTCFLFISWCTSARKRNLFQCSNFNDSDLQVMLSISFNMEYYSYKPWKILSHYIYIYMSPFHFHGGSGINYYCS